MKLRHGLTLLGAALMATAVVGPAAAQTVERVIVRPSGPGGWIGINYGTAQMETDDRRPVVVITNVVEGSPAEQAGLAVGDTLRSVNGLAASDALIGSLASSLSPGDEVQLLVRRGGRDVRITLEAGERPVEYLALSPSMGIVNFDSDSVMGRVRVLLDSVTTRLDGHQLPTIIAETMPLMADSLARMLGRNHERMPFLMDSLRMHMDSLGIVEFHGDSARFRTRLRVLSADSLRPFMLEWGDSLRGFERTFSADSLVRIYEGHLRLHRDSLFGDSARWRSYSFERGELPSVFRFGDSIQIMAGPAGMAWTVEGARRTGPVWRSFGERAVAGARLQEVEGALAAALELAADEGLLVLEVPEGTPAREAGLQVGDLIVRAGGSPLSTVEEFRRAVVSARGEPLPLEVLRRKERVRLTLTWS